MNKVLANFEPATKNQTWALYTCYRKDLRKLNLSKAEASMLIDDFNKGVNKELPKKYQIMLDNLTTDPYKVSSKVYEVVKAAENTISKANKADNKSAKVSPLFEYMTSNEVAQELISVLGAEFCIGSGITNDIDKTDKKAYLLLGGGLGFSHIKFDGRNKKVAKFVEESRSIKRNVEAYYMTLIDQNYLKKLEKSGNPIEAHFMQNLSYNTSYNYKVIEYLNSLGFKNITATSMLD